MNETSLVKRFVAFLITGVNVLPRGEEKYGSIGVGVTDFPKKGGIVIAGKIEISHHIRDATIIKYIFFTRGFGRFILLDSSVQ